MVKNFPAIITGLIAGMAAIFLGMMITSSLKPYPTGIDIHNPSAMDDFIKTFPEKVYIVKLIANIIAAFCGGLLSSLVAKKIKYQAGFFTVALLFALMIYRDLRFDYSVLYIVINLVISAGAGLLGVLTGSRRNVNA